MPCGMLMDTFHLGVFAAIAGMFILQILFTLFVIYYPVVKRYLDREETPFDFSLILISLIVEESANFFYPETAGVSIPTSVMKGSIMIGNSSIPYQMLIASGAAIITSIFFCAVSVENEDGPGHSRRQPGYGIRRADGRECRTHLCPGHGSFHHSTDHMHDCDCTCLGNRTLPLGSSLMMTAILVSILGGLGETLRGSIMASYIVGFLSSSVAFLVNPRHDGIGNPDYRFYCADI